MLPSDIERMALDRVPGSGAVDVKRLAAGLVNESYCVVRGGRRYSLRVATPDASGLGVDREWECRVLARAAAEGIAPRIECCDPRQGILVADWVQGRSWTLAEAGRQAGLEQMARLVRRVHGIPSPGAPRAMSPQDWIDYYRAALARRGANPAHPVGARAPRRLAALAALPPAPPVLCHSDLHIQNMVECERGLVLLDWEYAHVSDGSWDLAAWSCNNDLSADSSRFLLTCYLGRAPGETDLARLGHLKWLYDYVCLMWIDLYQSLKGGRDSGGLASRAGFLAARLENS